jgi:hypothetical protein
MENDCILYDHLEYVIDIWAIWRKFGNFVVIWYIFPRFGILCQEKSGNPGLEKGAVESLANFDASTALHCTALRSTALHCAALHCIAVIFYHQESEVHNTVASHMCQRPI